MPTQSIFRHRAGLLLACLIAAAIALVYLQVAHFEFLDQWDDGLYVSENRYVCSAPLSEALGWAITTFHAANWHPLTWISHIADCRLFGLNAGWHHAVNVLFHAINAVLLLEVLAVATGDLGRSAVVAALFALHPLNVENVAWIAERKGLLSTLFGLLAMRAYVSFVRTKSSRWYAKTFVFLALSLLSKSMLVTLPLLFLILDFWPLDRYPPASDSRASAISRVLPVLAEKLPFLVPSAAVGVMTIVAQQRGGAVTDLTGIPLEARIANAIVSYATYLSKLVWPVSLSALYPHPSLPGGHPVTLLETLSALCLLVGISVLAIWLRKRRPYLVTGWAWYVVGLGPVVGIIQVGMQGMADRYVYFPAIGLFIAAVWGGADLIEAVAPEGRGRPVAIAVALLVLLGSSYGAWSEAAHWKDPRTLYESSLAVTPSAGRLVENLGSIYLDAGRVADAVAISDRALQIDPAITAARLVRIQALIALGQAEPARRELADVLAAHPREPIANAIRGSLLAQAGDLDGAILAYRAALDRRPDDARIHYALANTQLAASRIDDAIDSYQRAISIQPHLCEAWVNLGVAFQRSGRVQEAENAFRAGLQACPNFEAARVNLRLLKEHGG